MSRISSPNLFTFTYPEWIVELVLKWDPEAKIEYFCISHPFYIVDPFPIHTWFLIYQGYITQLVPTKT